MKIDKHSVRRGIYGSEIRRGVYIETIKEAPGSLLKTVYRRL